MRWGILGLGSIASIWCSAAHLHTRHRVHAVGSRSQSRSDAFATKHGIARAYGSYEQLLADPHIEAVYIASPHETHHDLALLSIAAGKHVLIEKPIATTRVDAASILDAARKAQVLAMEGMWTRYLPQMSILRQLLADEAVGGIDSVYAECGWIAPRDLDNRLFDPTRSGGVILEGGAYPVAFIASVLGPPGRVSSTGSVDESGVDIQAVIALPYEDAAGVAAVSMRADYASRAIVNGTRGRIEFPGSFVMPSTIEILSAKSSGGPPSRLRWTDPERHGHEGLSYEVDAFASFVEEGRLESPVQSHRETVAVVAALETASRQIAASRERVPAG